MHALIVVDLQNDFMPGGALAVHEGDATVPVANRLMRRFPLVVATQDWHPRNHGSFVTQHPGHAVGDVIDLNGLEQILWPEHCVQDTPGAQFHRELEIAHVQQVFRKGIDAGIDSYSGFFDNGHRRATGMGDYLRAREVEALYVVGLALDVCVKYTVLDALRLGFATHVVVDGCRAVNLHPDDGATALAEMRAEGAHLLNSADALGMLV